MMSLPAFHRFRKQTAGCPAPGASTTARRRSAAGVTLLETVVAMMVTVIGLAGLFSTSAQC